MVFERLPTRLAIRPDGHTPFLVIKPGDHGYYVGYLTDAFIVGDTGETAPLAICRAALRMMEFNADELSSYHTFLNTALQKKLQ